MEDEAIIIPNRLHFISSQNPPRNKPKAYFFTIDADLIYEPFNEDFGPLNLAMVFKYVSELDKLMKNQVYLNHVIYHYTSSEYKKRSNSVFLMCVYQILIMKRSPDQAWKPFKAMKKVVPFRDASGGPATHDCTVLDCLYGMERAINLNWFDCRLFNIREYEYYEKVENGDMNWIIPNKLLAFGTPTSSRYSKGYRTFTPEDYCPVFKKLGVTAVIRLNQPLYCAERFTSNGIKHYDLMFPDGSCPKDEIALKFIDIVERTEGAVAVHCKAGLGRTGTLIALYAMKRYAFPPREFIAWCRIARPGSILGPQ
jgi:cell division cycle 14